MSEGFRLDRSGKGEQFFLEERKGLVFLKWAVYWFTTPTPSPWIFGIKELAGFADLNLGAQSLTGKILSAKDLSHRLRSRL